MCSMEYKELRDWEDIIDKAVEWFGMKWHKGMMKTQLRAYFPGISLKTMNHVISAAKHKICKLYGIDPLEYKGSQISFYESIIRGKKAKIEAKIKAAERLDKLFNLEQVSGIDPEITARKIREALAAMRETVPSKPKEEAEENNNGKCINEGKGNIESGQLLTPIEETEINLDEVVELPTEEMLNELRFNRDDPIKPETNIK